MSKKLLSAGVMLALVATVLVGVGAVTASAQSVTCANIGTFLTLMGITDASKIAAANVAMGCSAAAPAGAYTFTRNLSIGSTGADVTALQTKLGVTPATGYYGSITAAAVSAYQVANGIANPGTGTVGPLTLAKLNAGVAVTPTVPGCAAGALFSATTGASCTTGAGASTPVTGLTGNAGDITVTSLSTYSGEDVVAGDNDVKVLGLEVEADDGSDVAITSMKVELKQTVTTNSQRITDYVDSVDVYMGSTKVGSADAADFSESSDVYTKSVSLSGATIKAGEKAKFYIALNAVSNLDSGDIDDETFSVDVLSMRFMDGEGVTTTDSTNVTARTVDFTDLATSGDIEVKVSENSANPEDSSIQVDDTADTPDVLLLAVNMKTTGSNITIDDLNFNITTTGANADEMVSSYKLLVDGDEIDSISATSIEATTGNITFTDLSDDFNVSDGDTVVVKLVADIMDTGGDFGNGDSITASLTNTNLLAASSTIEDENGDNVAAGDRVGSVVGNTQAFYVDGIQVKLVSATKSRSNSSDTETNDTGTYDITFTVKAFGADAYVDSQSASGGTDGVEWSVTGDTFTGTMTSDVNCTGCTAGTGNYLVSEGETETFVLSVTLVNTAGTAGYYGVQVDEIGIGAADDATAETTITTGLDDLETTRLNLET